MDVVELRDRNELAAFLRRRPAVHAYALGDLDDFIRPHTRWLGLVVAGRLARRGSAARLVALLAGLGPRHVATLPEARGAGLATAACARLCRILLDDGIDTISLNVRADNDAAIRAYEKLAFAHAADYLEVVLSSRKMRDGLST